MESPNPLTYQDIWSWKSLLGVYIHPWEISVIKQLDNNYLSYISEQRKKQQPKSKGKK